jgi:hypothetical protein
MLKVVFESGVVVTFQNIFRSKMHENNIFLKKFIFDINT